MRTTETTLNKRSRVEATQQQGQDWQIIIIFLISICVYCKIMQTETIFISSIKDCCLTLQSNCLSEQGKHLIIKQSSVQVSAKLYGTKYAVNKNLDIILPLFLSKRHIKCCLLAWKSVIYVSVIFISVFGFRLTGTNYSQKPVYNVPLSVIQTKINLL